VTDFETQLDALRRALALQATARGFVTLTGPPGVGRRHLVRALGAMEAGAHVLSLDDDAATVSAALDSLAASDPESLVALHFEAVPSEATQSAVARAAHARPLVVVCSERWDHEAERVVHVPTLSVGASRALVRARLERAGGPTLGEEADAALARIARVCDGRPRALLLAAEQLTVLSPTRTTSASESMRGVASREPPTRRRAAGSKTTAHSFFALARARSRRALPTRSTRSSRRSSSCSACSSRVMPRSGSASSTRRSRPSRSTMRKGCWRSHAGGCFSRAPMP
jgi:hypothetical protein